MASLFHDIRYALRGLLKNKGFTAVVILTLALGIGANTAIFSIVDGVLLRPLPFRNAGQLVRLVDNLRGLGLRDVGMSVPELKDIDQRSGVFDQVSAVWPVDANLTGGDRPERIELLVVSPPYFSLLAVRPQLGRLFGPEDRAEGFAEAAVISDSLWRRLFSADPAVLGKKIRLDNDLYTVVGVMPPGFRHPGRTVATDVDVWGTAGFAANPFGRPQRAQRILPGAVGRLKPDETLREAQARLDVFTAALERDYPNDYGAASRWTVQLEPLQDAVVGNVRPLLWVLLGAVSLMLVTACVNIANLLLARAAGRQREIAVRQALGAARGRLIQQLLTESLVLSLLAGIAGVAAASGGMQLLLALVPSKLPRLNEVALDWRVMLFALAISLLTGVLFGLAPALQLAGVSLTSRESGPSRRQNRIAAGLVIAEFAISLVLMTGAGLLVRSFWKLTDANPGFNPRNVLAARIWLPVPNDPSTDIYGKGQDRTAFLREVLRRSRDLPGVKLAAIAGSIPFGNDVPPNAVTLQGRPRQPGDGLLAESLLVSPDYFTALQIPLVSGRLLQETDSGGAPLSVLVDRYTEHRFWPNESAIGKRLKRGGPQAPDIWATVVGVVGDVRHDGLDTDGVPHIYYSVYQRSGRAFGLLLRSSSDPASLSEPARRVIQSVDPNLPVFGVRTLSQLLDVSLGQHRFSAQLMAAFAILAMLLAAVGIYGVLAYSIGRRTREIGVRVALGARRGDVIGMVLSQALRMILLGTAIGTVSALAFSRLLAKLLYGVSVTDPVVFLIVPAVLVTIALIASYVPAWRATRIDPLVALRSE